MPRHTPRADRAAIDSDVDLNDPRQRREWTEHRWVLPAVAAGAMIGSAGRYALERAWPTPTGTVPWATFVTNVTGCALIGVLMVCVVEFGDARPLLRPFLGVGVLGGYTTFSTYAVQATALVRLDHPVLALAYVLGTAVAALAAVVIGEAGARLVVRMRPTSGDEP